MTQLAPAPTAELAAATWRKSSASATLEVCVELAVRPTVTGVRDTKNRAGGTLVLPTAARTALLAFARGGEELGGNSK